MPRKRNQAPGLGKTLIKTRFGKSSASHLHAAEIAAENNDDFGNLKSVTELTSLDDFLTTAELAGTEFTAERLNVHFVHDDQKGVLEQAEIQQMKAVYDENKHLLSIPRRPTWNAEMSKEELDKSEKESFLTWRRGLAVLQDDEGMVITPYEKNLDFWRQLWRVIERSDVIVQIVDARDPLLFRSDDLEKYVHEVDLEKRNIILINKADLLSRDQRQAWKKYFDSEGVESIFWSALEENEKLESKGEESDGEDGDSTQEECEDHNDDDDANDDLLTRETMIEYLKTFPTQQPKLVVGMVGYPNVGKSSTVNTLMGEKKAAVSATPGRTKHFQTLHVDEQLLLCDCPGLVFPSFVTNKSEMVLSGILSIDQMRDYVGPVNLLASRISRHLIEQIYGVNIDRPRENEDPDRRPTAGEVLSAHATSRGFMTTHGQPDNSRSARILLKDYVNGKLLYARPPPGVDEDEYAKWGLQRSKFEVSCEGQGKDGPKIDTTLGDLLENDFFAQKHVKSFTKGGVPVPFSNHSKSRDKKHHKNKKEKARRVRTIQY